MKKEIKNIKIGIAMLFVCALLCFVIVFLLTSCADGDDIPASADVEYIQIENPSGNNLNRAKNILAENGIAFEIIEDGSARSGFVSRLEFSGIADGNILNIEKGTSVKLFANTSGLNGKVAYITIDDGPTQDNTLKILDTLDKYGAKATFFVQGQNISKSVCEGLMLETVKRGHLVGCHSYSHDLSYIYSSPSNFLEELDLYESALSAEIGEDAFSKIPKVIRFPGGTVQNGHLNKSTVTPYIEAVEARGYKIYDWNCLNADGELRKWDRANESEAEYNAYATKAMKNSFEASLTRAEQTDEPLILLLHDKWTATDNGLTVDGLQFFEWMIKTLCDKGYILDTVEYLPSYID